MLNGLTSQFTVSVTIRPFGFRPKGRVTAMAPVYTSSPMLSHANSYQARSVNGRNFAQPDKSENTSLRPRTLAAFEDLAVGPDI